MYNSPFTPTISSAEIAEKLDELTELAAQVDRQDAAIAELRAEILSLRPKPVRIVRHDLDTAQVELR